jgi:hypothetical protein
MTNIDQSIAIESRSSQDGAKTPWVSPTVTSLTINAHTEGSFVTGGDGQSAQGPLS